MSKKLAINGHPTRGKEVIELLEMMGGDSGLSDTGLRLGGTEVYCVYHIGTGGSIIYSHHSAVNDNFIVFTLEEFLEKYPFKVNDKVVDDYVFGDPLTIKSMSWSEELKTMLYAFEESDVVLAAKDMKLVNDNRLSSAVENPSEFKSYTVNLNDGKAIDNSIGASQFMQMGKTISVIFNSENYEDEVELQLGDYEIEVRDGRTYAVKKKSKYPKTFDECLNLLYCKSILRTIIGHKAELLLNLEKLLICRDAYWKIYGEEMGLGKPWEPDWDDSMSKYIIVVIGNELVKDYTYAQNFILAFPTEEMRDAFYKNFKDLIKQCKELL